MDDEIWSPSEQTPIAQHFANNSAPSPQWQNMNNTSKFETTSHRNRTNDSRCQPGAGFNNAPINHIMIDPLLLGPGETNPYAPQQPPMHPGIPHREELMYAMGDMHLVQDPNTPGTMPPDFAHMGGYPLHHQHFPAVRQASPHSYGSGDTGSPQSGVSVSSSHQGVPPCKYPVLLPLLPHLGSIISVSMACDLLEFYFQSSSSIFMEPVSPYILGSVFRKRSFLRQHKPRKCSPALLASIIWIAAQTSEASYLTSSPSARSVICQKLWKLTVDLLKPLVHTPSGSHGFSQGSGGMVSPAPHDAFGVDRVIGRYESRMDTGLPPTSTLDDVATYLNLGVVTSASEYKAASLRWWNAAWSLARELKLGRELPQTPSRERDPNRPDGEADIGMAEGPTAGVQATAGTPAAAVIEETKEERRRLWWLLYMVDRHLGLCYNRPLAMLDNECEDLYQPVPDTVWQAGEFFTGASAPRVKGLNFQCTSHDIFGFFLPLMTILGDIVDLNAQKNHPRFGQRRTSSFELQESEITLQLERYAYSLEEFKHQHGCGASVDDVKMNPNNGTPDQVRGEWIHQTRKVAAYATHIMHVLHILTHGKWDPVSLLDDNNTWICSQSFLTATSNAISAAHAVEEILELDPDLSFMSYFFGMVSSFRIVQKHT